MSDPAGDNWHLDDPAGDNWHLDKRLPVAIILTILTLAAGVIWWGSQMSARIDVLERAVIVSNTDHERIIRMEATLTSIDQRLERMDDERRPR